MSNETAAQIPAEATPPEFPVFPVNNDRESIVANVKTNSARGLPELSMTTTVEHPVIIVGGGPSLNDYMGDLRALERDCDIFTINGAYKYLSNLGIYSDYFFLIDSRKENVVHVDDPDPSTVHILASQVHPDVFDLLKRQNVLLTHLGTEATMETLGGKGTFLTAPIGFAGIHAIYAAAALGYRTIYLFGYDFSYSDYHHAFSQPLNDDDKTIEVTIGDKVYRTTDAMSVAAQHFRPAIAPVQVQCNLDIRMFSDGLLPDLIRGN